MSRIRMTYVYEKGKERLLKGSMHKYDKSRMSSIHKHGRKSDHFHRKAS